MKKVLILFGGNSYEHYVSCESVNFILDNIDRKKFKYNIVGISFENEWYEIKKEVRIDSNWKNNISKKINNIISYLKKFDIVFPVIHGNTFEDGKLQAIFELNNINYVGCDSYSSLICYDKLLTKLILEKYSIPQVPYYIYNETMNFKSIDYPVIIKPCKCGSSIGISVANNYGELIDGINLACKYDKNIIIEKYIKNRKELECAILDKKNELIVSDVGEILNNSALYSYDLKYKEKTESKISNANIDIKKKIRQLSKEIFKVLKCKDLSRIDFIYDIDMKKLYFNEINTMPGFTNISMYPKLIMDSGMSAKKLVSILLS